MIRESVEEHGVARMQCWQLHKRIQKLVRIHITPAQAGVLFRQIVKEQGAKIALLKQ